MKNPEPRGAGRHVLGALLLLVAISYGAHLIEVWLKPLVPLLIVGAALIAIYRFIQGWRWWH